MNNLLKFRAIWPYALGAVPFLGCFIYELAVAWSQRPVVADTVHGFVFAMQTNGRTVYLSSLDMWLAFGSWFVAAGIVLAGLWKVRKQLKRR